MSEEPVLGVEAGRAGAVSFPGCPPGSFVLAAAACRASARSRAYMASLMRRFRQRSASLCVLPSATLRS